MSPTSKAVQDIKDAGWLWGTLLQVSLVLVPTAALLFSPVLGWLFVEQSRDTAFRERGERVTVETYNQRQAEIDRKLDASDIRQRTIMDSLGRLDERLKSVGEDVRMIREEVKR